MEKTRPKNYIVLIIIIIITVLATFYLRNIYIAEKEYNATNSVIQKVATQINEDEINNYLIESPNTILYTSSGQNTEIKDFEKQFQKLLEKEGIASQTVYINRDTISDQESFQTKLNFLALNDTIKNQLSDQGSCAIYIFENQKIKYVIINPNQYEIDYLKKLFQQYEVIDNE